MPFKDIATVDSILLREVPPSTDTDARAALRRLIEVSVGVVVPAEVLEADPVPNAVALMSLTDAVAKDGKVRSFLVFAYVLCIQFVVISQFHFCSQPTAPNWCYPHGCHCRRNRRRRNDP
jgi:hypothetical protein